MATFEFRLPDLGEGLTEATIVRWLVDEGQAVVVDTPLVEVETAKTTVELPSPYAGTVTALQVAQDATVAVGSVLITLEIEGPPSEDAQSSAGSHNNVVDEPDGDPPLLIGYGASRKPVSSAQETSLIKAKPPVRKLARDLGVDLSTLRASGAKGEITREDVLAHTAMQPAESGVTLTGIRKHMANAMARSASESPQATLFLSVDVTQLISLRDQLNKRLTPTGTHLSVFGLMCFLFTQAVSAHSLANSSYDAQTGKLTVHPHVNLGIAVAGPSGLVVPNVKMAETLSLGRFASELSSLIEAARTDSLRTDQLLGGTITVTNVGALGIDSGAPLLNAGEAAILAVGAVKRRPWVLTDSQEQLAIRSVVELALTIDHRIMDGKDGAHILTATAALFEQPALLLASLH